MVKFAHIPWRGSRVTAAYITTTSGVVCYDFAWCSPKDRFCRKIGRAIAQGRLKNTGGFIDSPEHNEPVYCFLERMLLMHSLDSEAPRWARI